MTQLNHKYEYPEDITRIIRVASECGIELTPETAANLWEDYSDGFCAGWMVLPRQDTELRSILIIMNGV